MTKAESMLVYAEDFVCDLCGAIIGKVYGLDLNGSYFYCAECFKKATEGRLMRNYGKALYGLCLGALIFVALIATLSALATGIGMFVKWIAR